MQTETPSEKTNKQKQTKQQQQTTTTNILKVQVNSGEET